MTLTNTYPEIFVGREEILRTLNKRLEALKSGYRQNVALTGERLCGKTSILQYFLSGLNDATLVPVYIEVLTEPFENFSKKFIGTILLNFLKTCPSGEPKAELPYLLSRAEQVIPKTAFAAREILRLLEKQDYQEAYSALFNLTTILKEETKKSCIIIFDEFHNLSFFNLKNPFAVFGKKIMVQKDTMYIVTSSQVSSIKKILKERLDLLFGNFEILEVKDFDYSVSKRFLEKRLEGIRVPEELGDFIISFTDGRPFYLDIISSELIHICAQLQFKWLTTSHIAQAFENLLFDSKGTINQYFENLISALAPPSFINDYMDIVSAISEGNMFLTQIRRHFSGKTADLSRRIEKLLEENIITKNGSIYYLNDGIFEFWLRYVYNRKRYSLLNTFQDRSNLFKKEVGELIVNFTQRTVRPISERLKELFTCFNGETIKIGEKNIRFPRFAAVAVKESPEGEIVIEAIYENRRWIAQFSRQAVTEASIFALIKNFDAAAPMAQKKILVVPGGIDTNSMLIAKENRIWVWPKETLNFIMSLYKRPKILELR